MARMLETFPVSRQFTEVKHVCKPDHVDPLECFEMSRKLLPAGNKNQSNPAWKRLYFSFRPSEFTGDCSSGSHAAVLSQIVRPCRYRYMYIPLSV